MPSPNATPTPITPPRVPLIDPRTGLIDRAWYLFFLSLNNIATAVIDDSGLTFSAESVIASYDAALRTLADEVGTQPVPVDFSVELAKQIEAAGLSPYAPGLLSQVAEMQKQIDAFNLLPPPTQGTVTAVTATAPVVSSGGTAPDISMPAANTTTNGYLTSTDWNTFNNKQPAGTYVTSISVVSTNGLAGTSSGGATPALTLSTSITGILKGNGTAISAATSGTDYAPATSGTSILYGNGSGGFSNVTIGTGVSFVAGTLSATGSGGTVTAVSVVSANGFAGTSSGGATPALTLTTSITGLLYGNGTALAAATVSAPLNYTSGTLSIPVATTSANGYLSSTDWTTFNNKGSGTVTSVAALTLGTTGTDLTSTVATGTTTPVITLNVPTASASNRGALSSTDWSTFNNKQAVSAPVTKTADFTVAATDLWLINNKTGSTCTATLPTASSYSGRILHFQNYQAQTLVSASSNVVPLAGGSAGTSILLASTGDSATLVSDGTNWLMTQYVPNNILLLE
jgi:hypothetical protein